MNRLKELRKDKGLTLDDIEEELGIGRGTYNNYENGKTFPKLKTLVKMATFYDVTIDYMLGVAWTPCALERNEESDFEFLKQTYNLEYCPYCGRKL